jgi:ribosomal protein S18 acetylase RimI-like enzyme
MRQDGVSFDNPSGFTIHRLKAPKGDELVVTQLLAMEKKLWKKTDSWGGLLEKELTRRNTFTLYATTTLPSTPSSAPPATPPPSEVVAYLIFTATGLVCHISKVVVVPEIRRQGLGRALVQAAIEIAKKERRVGSITLHVDADNTPALGLYTSLGFESEGMLEVGFVVSKLNKLYFPAARLSTAL